MKVLRKVAISDVQRAIELNGKYGYECESETESYVIHYKDAVKAYHDDKIGAFRYGVDGSTLADCFVHINEETIKQ